MRADENNRIMYFNLKSIQNLRRKFITNKMTVYTFLCIFCLASLVGAIRPMTPQEQNELIALYDETDISKALKCALYVAHIGSIFRELASSNNSIMQMIDLVSNQLEKSSNPKAAQVVQELTECESTIAHQSQQRGIDPRSPGSVIKFNYEQEKAKSDLDLAISETKGRILELEASRAKKRNDYAAAMRRRDVEGGYEAESRYGVLSRNWKKSEDRLSELEDEVEDFVDIVKDLEHQRDQLLERLNSPPETPQQTESIDEIHEIMNGVEDIAEVLENRLNDYPDSAKSRCMKYFIAFTYPATLNEYMINIISRMDLKHIAAAPIAGAKWYSDVMRDYANELKKSKRENIVKISDEVMGCLQYAGQDPYDRPFYPPANISNGNVPKQQEETPELKVKAVTVPTVEIESVSVAPLDSETSNLSTVSSIDSQTTQTESKKSVVIKESSHGKKVKRKKSLRTFSSVSSTSI